MFERFTDRARRVVVLAQDEARGLGHDYIGTEHILLGLIHEGEGIGALTLQALKVDLTAARAEVVAIIGKTGGLGPTGHIPFTPRAKKVLELALREALGLGHNYIGTEHILLGVVREGEGVASRVLVGLGVTVEETRAKVIELLAAYRETAIESPPTTAAGFLGRAGITPGLEQAFNLAKGLAGAATVGTQHLLAVFARHDGFLAHRLLAEGGFVVDSLAQPPEDSDVAGTLDETPLQAAARASTIDLDAQDLAVRLTDPELGARIRDAIRDGHLDPDQVRREIGQLWQNLDRLRGQATPQSGGEPPVAETGSPEDVDPPPLP